MSDGERRTTFELELLEGRVVPSTVHAGLHVRPTALVRGTGYLFLNGTAQLQVHQVPGIPDTGTTYYVHGSGSVSPLGAVGLSGSLHGTGFIQMGSAGGTIQLSNGRGSVILSLVGPPQPGFTPLESGTYQFTMVKGTGAYAKDLANGTVDLTLSGNSISLTFHGAPNRF